MATILWDAPTNCTESRNTHSTRIKATRATRTFTEQVVKWNTSVIGTPPVSFVLHEDLLLRVLRRALISTTRNKRVKRDRIVILDDNEPETLRRHFPSFPLLSQYYFVCHVRCTHVTSRNTSRIKHAIQRDFYAKTNKISLKKIL